MRDSIASLVVLFAVTGGASAQIVLDQEFDHGSLDIASTSVVGSNVQLVGRDNFNPGSWKWIYFKASGVQGITPQFSIGDNLVGGGSQLNNYRFYYSYDNENWDFFDNGNRAGGIYSFSNNSPFSQDEVYVAYNLPYSYGMSAQLVSDMAASPFVEPTASADANLVIGQSPGGVDDLGRTIAPLDMWAFKLTDFDYAHPKWRITLMSGVHAQETLGSHTLEGMLRFLVSDDPAAQQLRRRAEFFVYPMANPDGRFAGLNRSTVQSPFVDPNCCWSPTGSSNWQNKPDLKLTGEAMLADHGTTRGGETDYFIDFHSSIGSGSDFAFIEFEKGHVQDPFWQALIAREPQLGAIDSTSTGPTTANFADWFLGADFDMTFETRFFTNQTADFYADLGESFARAFHDALPSLIPGDFDDDSDVDGDDFKAWQRGESPAPFSSDDLLDWEENYRTNASASAAATAVPEPALLVVLLLAPLARAR